LVAEVVSRKAAWRPGRRRWGEVKMQSVGVSI
jgi:hypothetical protein